MPDPEHTLAEMARCAQRHLLVSVPREPLWRDAEHGARRLSAELGNTPGPSQPLVQALVRATALAPREVVRDALAVPLDDAACPPLARGDALLRQRRQDPVGRDRLHGPADVRLLLDRKPRARRSVGQADRPAVVGDVRDHLGDLPTDRTAALAHDRRAPRARSRRAPMRVPIGIQGGFALVFLIVALALHEQLVDNVFDHYGALYDVLLIGTLAYAASYFARGWLAGPPAFRAVRRAGADGVAVAHLLRARGRARHRQRADGGGAGDRRRAVRLAGRRAGRVRCTRRRAQRPSASAARGARSPSTRPTPRWPARAPRASRRSAAHDELSLRRGAGSRSAVSGIMLSEQTLLNAAVLTVDATSAQQGAGGHRVQRAADRARAAAAVPGDPDLAAAASDRAGGDRGPRRRSRARSASRCWRSRLRAAVALGLLAIGPFVMGHLFGSTTPTAASAWRSSGWAWACT